MCDKNDDNPVSCFDYTGYCLQPLKNRGLQRAKREHFVELGIVVTVYSFPTTKAIFVENEITISSSDSAQIHRRKTNRVKAVCLEILRDPHTIRVYDVEDIEDRNDSA